MRRLLLIAPMLFAAAATAGGQKLAKLTEDLRLDATREDFPRVGAVVVGPQEQIVVLVPTENEFRVYDKNGKKLGSFGRTGSGPGEFRGISNLGWVADTIWVHDYSLRRISWFGPDLKLLRTVPTPEAKMEGAITPTGQPFGLRFSPSIVLGDGYMVGGGNVSRSANALQQWEQYIGVQSPAGDVTKLPFSPKFEDPRIQMFHAGFYRNVPFMIGPQVASSSDGSRIAILKVDNTERDGGVIAFTTYRVGDVRRATTAEAAFKVELSKTIRFEGEAIPKSVRDSVLATFNGRATEGPADLRQRFQEMARERMPPFYAPAEGIILGLDQTVWLIRSTKNDHWSADVYDGTGNLLGRVEPPHKTRIRHGTATHVWTTQRDDDDLISIVRYRIDWQK